MDDRCYSDFGWCGDFESYCKKKEPLNLGCEGSNCIDKRNASLYYTENDQDEARINCENNTIVVDQVIQDTKNTLCYDLNADFKMMPLSNYLSDNTGEVAMT